MIRRAAFSLLLLLALSGRALAQTPCGAAGFGAAGNASCGNGGSGGTVANQPGSDGGINVKNYGAKGDGIIKTDGAMAAVDRAAGCTGNCGGSSFTQNVPTGTANNDLMLLEVCTFASITSGLSAWTQVDTANASNNPIAVLYKRTASSEPASYTIGFSGASFGSSFILDFPNSTAAVDVEASATSTSTSTITYPSVTTTQANDLVLHILCGGGLTQTTPVGDQPMQMRQPGSSFSYFASAALKATAGATGTATATQTGSTSTNWVAFTVALKGTGLFPTTLTSASSNFVAGDVGKVTCVGGTSGFTVTDTQGTRNKEQCGTVSGFTDSHDVTLSFGNVSGAAITGQTFYYATNDDTAITSAVAAGCGSTVYFPTGLYGKTTDIVPCVTQGTILKGTGGGNLTYEYGTLFTPITGRSPSTAILWATTSGVTAAGINLGSGLSGFSGSEAAYVWQDQIRDMGLIAGIPGAYDGGAAAADCIRLNDISHTMISGVYCEGWGGNGLNLTLAGSGFIAVAHVLNSMFHLNGSRGIMTAGPGIQQLNVEDTDVSVNWLNGIELHAVGGFAINNSIPQSNNQSATNPGYELFAGNEGINTGAVIGSWLEDTQAGANTTFFNINTNWIGVDGLGGTSTTVNVPQTLIPLAFSASTTPLPACTNIGTAYMRRPPTRVYDSTACTNGTTYVSGGNVQCLVQCFPTNQCTGSHAPESCCTGNQTGCGWVETGQGWY